MVIPVFVGLLAAWMLAAPTASSQPSPKIREIRNSTAIPAQLLPDDEIVVVKEARSITTDYVYFGNETPQQEIARQVNMADGVVIVDVETVNGSLIEHDTWIRTKVTGKAAQVIKNPSMFPKGRVEFQYNNGVVQLNGVEVRAGDYPHIAPGARWLVFIHSNGDDRWLAFNFDVSDPSQVTRPRFENVAPATSPNPFKGMSLDQAINEMRKSVPK